MSFSSNGFLAFLFVLAGLFSAHAPVTTQAKTSQMGTQAQTQASKLGTKNQAKSLPAKMPTTGLELLKHYEAGQPSEAQMIAVQVDLVIPMDDIQSRDEVKDDDEKIKQFFAQTTKSMHQHTYYTDESLSLPIVEYVPLGFRGLRLLATGLKHYTLSVHNFYNLINTLRHELGALAEPLRGSLAVGVNLPKSTSQAEIYFLNWVFSLVEDEVYEKFNTIKSAQKNNWILTAQAYDKNPESSLRYMHFQNLSAGQRDKNYSTLNTHGIKVRDYVWFGFANSTLNTKNMEAVIRFVAHLVQYVHTQSPRLISFLRQHVEAKGGGAKKSNTSKAQANSQVVNTVPLDGLIDALSLPPIKDFDYNELHELARAHTHTHDLATKYLEPTSFLRDQSFLYNQPYKNNVLIEAVRASDLALFKEALKMKANPHLVEFEYAVESGQVKVLKALMKQGYDLYVNMKNTDHGQRAQIVRNLVENKAFDMLRFLLAQGFTVNQNKFSKSFIAQLEESPFDCKRLLVAGF